jgi:di/tricarboxylate transporter
MRKISFMNFFLVGVTISLIGAALLAVGGIMTDYATEAIQIILGEGSASEARMFAKLLQLSVLGAVAMILLVKYPPELIDKASPSDRISASAEAEES